LGLGDRIRAFFSKRGNPALLQLDAFVAEHKGIEGFVEPRTTTNPTTLLLVDRYGKHVRAPVRDPRDAYSFCEQHGIPVYEAQVVGYPKRMKDFEKKRRAAADDAIDQEIADLERRLAEIEEPPQE
jgi:hypothetical protein